MPKIKKLLAPSSTKFQQVRLAILCAKQVCSDPEWNEWADAWISGADCSFESARVASSLNLKSSEFAAAMAADAAFCLTQDEDDELYWEVSSAKFSINKAIRLAIAQLPTINLSALAARAIKEEPQ